MGVSLADLNEALQVYLGSVYVNDFNLFGRTYQVTAQAEPSFRKDPSDVTRIKIRNQAGEMVPLGALVKVVKTGGADRVQRYNLYYSRRHQWQHSTRHQFGADDRKSRATRQGPSTQRFRH